MHRSCILALALFLPAAVHAQTTDPAELARQLMEEARRYDPDAAGQTPFVMGLTADSASAIAYLRANRPSPREVLQLADMLGRAGEFGAVRMIAAEATTAEERDAVLATLPHHIAMRSGPEALAFADSIETPAQRLVAYVSAAAGLTQRQANPGPALDRAIDLARTTPLPDAPRELSNDLSFIASADPARTRALMLAIEPAGTRLAILQSMVGPQRTPATLAQLLLEASDAMTDPEIRLTARANALLALGRDADATAAVDTLMLEAKRSVVPSNDVLGLLRRIAGNLALEGDSAYGAFLATVEAAAPPQVTFEVASGSIYPTGPRFPGDPGWSGRQAAAVVALNAAWRAAEAFPPAQAAEMRASVLARVGTMLPDTALRRIASLPADRRDAVRLAVAKGLVVDDLERARTLADGLPEAAQVEWTIDAAGRLVSVGRLDAALALATVSDSAAPYVHGIVGSMIAQQGARDSAAVLLRRSLTRLRFPADGERNQRTSPLEYQIVPGGVIALGAEEMADWARLHPAGPGRGRALAAVAQGIGRSRERAALNVTLRRSQANVPEDLRQPLFERLREGWLALPTDTRAQWAGRVVPTLGMLVPEGLAELLADPRLADGDWRLLGGVDETALQALLEETTDPALRDRIHATRALRTSGMNVLPLLEAVDSIRSPEVRLRVLTQGLSMASTSFPVPGRDSGPAQRQLATDAAAVLADLPATADTIVSTGLTDADLDAAAAAALVDALEDGEARAVVLGHALRSGPSADLLARARDLADSLPASPALALRAVVAASDDAPGTAVDLLQRAGDAVDDATRRATVDLARSTILVLARNGHADASARAAVRAIDWTPADGRLVVLFGALAFRRNFADTVGVAAAEAATWDATEEVPLPLRDTLRALILLSRATRTGVAPEQLAEITDATLRDAVRGMDIMRGTAEESAVDSLVARLETDARRNALQAARVAQLVQSGDTADAVRIAGRIPPGRARAAADLAIARARNDAGDPATEEAARAALRGYRVDVATPANGITQLQGLPLDMLTIVHAVAILGVPEVLEWADAQETPEARLSAWLWIVTAAGMAR